MENADEWKNRSAEWEEAFYHKYVPVAKITAGRILYPIGTQEDIEEVVHDAVCEAMVNFHKYDESRGSIETYIRIITKSRALTFRKRQERYKTVPLDNCLELWTEDEDVAGLKDVVRCVLKGLKPKEQDLFTCRFLYHMTPEEIANQAGCSRRAVDSRLSRLRRKLENEFRKNGMEINGGA